MNLPRGSLESLGQASWLQAVLPHFEGLTAQRAGALRIETSAGEAYLKYSHLRGKHRWRHAARCILPGQNIPRLQEFSNLEWLRQNGLGAPEPLVAGVVRRAGLPSFQFLATRFIHGARDLRALNPRACASELAGGLFGALGGEVARMHNLGFVHRDLYPRNILASLCGGDWQLQFLDAWRGGPGPGLRGPDYDLACFLLFAPLLFEEQQSAAFLEAYFEERRCRPTPRLQRRILHLRARLLQQLISKGRRRHELPQVEWRLPI